MSHDKNYSVRAKLAGLNGKNVGWKYAQNFAKYLIINCDSVTINGKEYLNRTPWEKRIRESFAYNLNTKENTIKDWDCSQTISGIEIEEQDFIRKETDSLKDFEIQNETDKIRHRAYLAFLNERLAELDNTGPTGHPFLSADILSIFKYLDLNYLNDTQTKYTYIFNFIVEQKIDSGLTQSDYFNWLAAQKKVTTKKPNQHAQNKREYSKLTNLYNEYQGIKTV